LNMLERPDAGVALQVHGFLRNQSGN
jgi:hypothetical protein